MQQQQRQHARSIDRWPAIIHVQSPEGEMYKIFSPKKATLFCGKKRRKLSTYIRPHHADIQTDLVLYSKEKHSPDISPFFFPSEVTRPYEIKKRMSYNWRLSRSPPLPQKLFSAPSFVGRGPQKERKKEREREMKHLTRKERGPAATLNLT